MSVELWSPELLIVIGSGLVVVGAGMLWACRTGTRFVTPAGIRRAQPGTRRCRARPPTGPMGGRSGALVGAGFVGGVIAGVQWVLVVSTTTTAVSPSAAWMLVLGVPGFLAGATVLRLFAVIAIWRRRHREPAEHGRSGRR